MKYPVHVNTETNTRHHKGILCMFNTVLRPAPDTVQASCACLTLYWNTRHSTDILCMFNCTEANTRHCTGMLCMFRTVLKQTPNTVQASCACLTLCWNKHRTLCGQSEGTDSQQLISQMTIYLLCWCWSVTRKSFIHLEQKITSRGRKSWNTREMWTQLTNNYKYQTNSKTELNQMRSKPHEIMKPSN